MFPIWERKFDIQPFKYERNRLPFKMNNEERLWRKQWLEDQVLHPDEPQNIPNLDKLRLNPIRYRWMRFWDGAFNKIRPIVGGYTPVLRYSIPKILVIHTMGILFTYYCLYRKQNWEYSGGASFYGYKGDWGTEAEKHLTSQDYYDRGFQARKACRYAEHKY
ncbi:unnamed protein product [Didymodactylos carnosus]|uniref:NADH dehydrogenase [ubiquinone] 1 beta subcomplex subunit 6 n=2 Tax=Didymodactylos carnosus TaxID=1234261 RepID=A0A8S2SNB5_9BILA|nr:unnamed protein product [Didymodactylos carnosus]CAF4211188.1 unnamed protein product [Didymodactylos carnosus]